MQGGVIQYNAIVGLHSRALFRFEIQNLIVDFQKVKSQPFIVIDKINSIWKSLFPIWISLYHLEKFYQIL